jgi:hypothetical protein
MPNLLRGYGRPARRVHAEHDGLHVIVIGKLSKVVGHRLADNGLTAEEVGGGIVDDFSTGIINRNLLAFFFLLLTERLHVRHRQLRNIVVLLNA